jgi:predicted alpha/beta-hydrolase family hydrolase
MLQRLLLTHGAGQGTDSEFMQMMDKQLNERGIATELFNFPYMQQQIDEGKKRPPSSIAQLQKYFIQRLEACSEPVFIGGKSMGGRVATMIADHPKVKGIACLGYPFHPPGKPNKLRIEHLKDIAKPVLILQGERDPFGKKGEVEAYPLSQMVSIEWVAVGEHSFKPTKTSGVSLAQNIAFAASKVAEFMEGAS